MPTASEALRACMRSGIDVRQAFARFRPATASLLGACGDAELAAWLAAQRGGRAIGTLAARAGYSRYRVSRILSGQTRTRLPDFFALVQALTGRLTELVAALVDIQRVPSLLSAHRQVLAARSAALEQPWSSAVLALLATGVFRGSMRVVAANLATVLDISPAVAQTCLSLLREADVVRQRRGGYEVRSALVVDTRDEPAVMRKVQSHWADTSYGRLAAPRAHDLFSHNVFSVSRADFARMRQVQLDFFQQMRAIAAESEPSEVAGLVTVHLLQWDPVSAQEQPST